MMRGRINWSLIAKCAWVAASLTIWLMGFGSCITEPDCGLARDGALPILCMLSFPASIVFLILNEILLGVGIIFDTSPAFHFTFLSLGTIAVGYLQWFHVIPALFGRRGLTVLSLNQPALAAKVEQVTTQKPARVKLFAAKPIPAFDKAGRSPLERVISRPPA